MPHQTLHSTVTTAELAAGQASDHTLLPFMAFVSPEWRVHPLTGSALQVGRSASRDLPLTGKRVSRLHCEFRAAAGAIRLSDAGSRNGTFVNGKPANDTELLVGDVVRIGDWVGIFCRGSNVETTNLKQAAPGLIAGPSLSTTLKQAEAVAQTTLPVTLSGESGTGKECVARFIHDCSQRRGPFVALNCAAIPETLAESELFGHHKGAFTGADASRAGAFQQASGGTLLLDEIADLPLSIQAKLLRVLEEGQVTPLGSTRAIAVDVRVITAGQSPLGHLVAQERFRGDLFARLNGLALRVPPLRDRREDIVALFVAAFEKASGRVPSLAPELAEALLLYDWPFNVRELVQVARRIAVLFPEVLELRLEHAPDEIANAAEPEAPTHSEARVPALPERLDQVEMRELSNSRQLQELKRALAQTKGNITRAAATLGISRGRAYRLMAMNKAMGSKE